MSTLKSGHRAEEAAREYLAERDFVILAQNYRRPHCEIDIVAQRDDRIYFIEVKYRAADTWGGGLEYVTASKVRRMQRGAETWVKEFGWHGPYQLSAIEVSGRQFDITAFIQDVL